MNRFFLTVLKTVFFLFIISLVPVLESASFEGEERRHGNAIVGMAHSIQSHVDYYPEILTGNGQVEQSKMLVLTVAFLEILALFSILKLVLDLRVFPERQILAKEVVFQSHFQRPPPLV